MHRQYVHVGSRTIGYLDSAPGDRDRRVAVLIHAFPLAAAMWEAQLKAAPPGWRVIAPDLRGFGGSTPVEDGQPPMIDDYAADVVDLLGDLDVRGAVIGGLSMGGYVTFAVLRRAPELVRALFLADTKAGADTLEARANRRSMLALLDREGPSGVAEAMIPKLLSPPALVERPDLASTVRRAIKQQSAQAIRGAILRLMERPDSTLLLGTIRVPTLVLVGGMDSVTPVAEARAMAESIPDAELVVIPASGHLSNLEHPDAFNAAFSAFLTRL